MEEGRAAAAQRHAAMGLFSAPPARVRATPVLRRYAAGKRRDDCRPPRRVPRAGRTSHQQVAQPVARACVMQNDGRYAVHSGPDVDTLLLSPHAVSRVTPRGRRLALVHPAPPRRRCTCRGLPQGGPPRPHPAKKPTAASPAAASRGGHHAFGPHPAPPRLWDHADMCTACGRVGPARPHVSKAVEME